MRATWTTLAACAAASMTGADSLAGQAATGAYEVGVGVGLFADYPSDFSTGSCWNTSTAGLTGFVRRSLNAHVSLEGSATVTSGFLGQACVDALRAVPLDGEVFPRVSLDEDIPGASAFAAQVAAVVEPLPTRALAPRVRVGAGRLVNKHLWSWSYGAGLRFRRGSSTIVLEAERWNFGYDLRRELLVYRDSGAHELQSIEIIRQSPKPWLFRMSWARRIG